MQVGLGVVVPPLASARGERRRIGLSRWFALRGLGWTRGGKPRLVRDMDICATTLGICP